MDLAPSRSSTVTPAAAVFATTSGAVYLVRPNTFHSKQHNQHFHHSTNTSTSAYSSTSGALNVDVLQLINMTESKNFTCQAQNSFGLVVFNLTLVIKGKQMFFSSSCNFFFILFFWMILTNPFLPCPRNLSIVHKKFYLLFIEPEFKFLNIFVWSVFDWFLIFWICWLV